MIKDFQILSKLGEGAYSSVYKVKRISDNQIYAMKRVKLLSLKEKEKENALNEIWIIASIRHPNLVCYKEAFWENNSNSLWLVKKHYNGVLQWRRPFSEDHEVPIKKSTLSGERNLGYIYTDSERSERTAQEKYFTLRYQKCKYFFDFKRRGEDWRYERLENCQKRFSAHSNWHSLLCISGGLERQTL